MGAPPIPPVDTGLRGADFGPQPGDPAHVREYWRWHFAGQVLPVLAAMNQSGIQAVLRKLNDKGPPLPERAAALLADALLARLEGEEGEGTP